MTVPIIDWPLNISYKLIDLAINARTQSPGKSVLGSEQLGLSNADVWVCDIEFNTLHFNVYEGTTWVKAYRAWLASLDGRYGVFRLPIYDSAWTYGIDAFGAFEDEAWAGQPFGDDTLFDDDVGFDTTIQFNNVVVAAVAQGLTEVVFNVTNLGTRIGTGNYFTLDTYLYIATGSYLDTATNREYVTFKPPLRVAATTGSIFDWPPYLIAQLADDLQGRHPLDYGLFVAPRFSVEEFRDR